jgi:Ca-activated chloride channel family protein
MRNFLSSTLLAGLIATPICAEERPATMLVLDASGSMWGQIDGTAKITIAQGVIDGLLSETPDDQVLGIIAYGHRRKGDCSDIETLVLPASGTRSAISQAVNALKPKGKTPMSDAVQAAALAMRHSEEAATVILVADGIETCAPDPCAAARAGGKRGEFHRPCGRV